MTKIGPKELALKAQREENLEIPKFLKRQESPEQEEKRRAKYKKKDKADGLKVIEPVAAMPEKIRKAIEKDLRDSLDPNKTAGGDVAMANAVVKKSKPPLTKTLLQAVLSGEVSTGDALTKIGGFPKNPKPKKEKKLPRGLEKALAEKEKLNALSQVATQNPMESTVKKSAKKTKVKSKTKVKKASAKRASNGSYDWDKAEALAKAGTVPPLPNFNHYGPHLKHFHELAKKKDLKGIKEYSAEFKNETGARVTLFRFRDLCVMALKNA